MLIVHVFVHVKEDRIEDFKRATLENARNSINEPGIARFDVVQKKDDPAPEAVTSKCPVDLVFGVDFDKYNECDTCKVWDNCKEANSAK